MGRLDSMLLWGHAKADYEQKFALDPVDLDKTILDYGAGPASFAAEMYAAGKTVIACDPIYAQTKQSLQQIFEKEFAQMNTAVAAHPERFVWQRIRSANELEQVRREVTALFLNDFAQGKQQGRYLACQYPDLDFAAHSFQLALASYAVFMTHDDKPAEFLVQLLLALARIAQEVRVFPLLDGDGNISPLVGPVLLGLQQQRLHTEVRQVNYEFQRGGNAMLRLWLDTCVIGEQS
jgi:SAM-dependent methyltransferase